MTERQLEHGWQLTGTSADAYEQLLVPAIFEPWARGLVNLADPRPGEHDALERRAGAGGIMRAPFAFGDQETLRRLLLAAGFDRVRILIDVKVCRFPSVAEFLRYEVLASPLADPVGRLDSEARDGLIADLE